MDRSEQARELFLSGHNCSQSVLLSFADELKFSRELALRIAAGFGGGMGKLQETCGAVTGSIMVLGMIQGERANNNDELKDQSYTWVRDFNRQFVSEFGTTCCKDLIGCDLSTREGTDRFRKEGMMEKVCARCIKSAVRIVESLTVIHS